MREQDLIERVLDQIKRDTELNPNISYAAYVGHHKYCVARAMISLGLPWWRALLHDAQKLTPTEWKPYVDTFFRRESPRQKDGSYDPNAVPSDEFRAAWHHHISSGRTLSGHHWEFWTRPDDDNPVRVMEMPHTYRLEMLADWMGAGRSIAGTWDPHDWYLANRDKMMLHPETREWIEQRLGVEEAVHA